MSTVSAGRQKVEAAKEAANALVDALYGAKTTSDLVKISVVPYTSTVKVGTEYAGASWVDTGGVSSIHWQTVGGTNATIEKPSWATSRFDLFNQLGIAWGGCFEVRPNGLGFTDERTVEPRLRTACSCRISRPTSPAPNRPRTPRR